MEANHTDLSLIIPVSAKDTDSVNKNLDRINRNLDIKEIYIIGKKDLKEKIINADKVHFIDENTMIPSLTFETVKKIILSRYPKAVRRTGWYFQQFLKLGFAYISETEYYLTWDSDTIPLKHLSMFNHNGVPYLDCRKYEKADEPYFLTIQNLWSDGSVKKNDFNSYITEHMIFSRKIVKEMLSEIINNSALRGDTFFEKILNAVPIKELNLSGFSEFETYATYLINKKPCEYEFRRWKNLRHGKSFFGINPTEKQLRWASEFFDAISIEDFDSHMLICRWLCNEKFTEKHSFEHIYKKIQPVIDIKYCVRMTLRNIIGR